MTAFLRPAKNNELKSALIGIGNRTVLQTAPLRSLKFAHTEDRLGDSNTVQHTDLFMGDLTPKLDRHTTKECRSRHILNVTLLLWSVN
jgi:hypothetical protein